MNKEKIETTFNEVKKLHIPLFLAIIMISHLIIDVIYFITCDKAAAQASLIHPFMPIYVGWSIIVIICTILKQKKFDLIQYEEDDDFKNIFDWFAQYYWILTVSIVFCALICHLFYGGMFHYPMLIIVMNCVIHIAYPVINIKVYYKKFYIPTKKLITDASI